MSLIISLLLLLAILVGLSKLFPLVDEKYKSWYAFIPVYNLYIWLKIIEKPWWWIILLLFPGPNILMISIMVVNTGTVFGYRETKDVVLGGFLPFFYLPYWSFSEQPKHIGQIDRVKFPKSSAMEWRDAILFAVVAASIIRTYTFEAFTIPTGSMEKSLLIGDYLFVDKLAYGPKTPITPIAFPFAHHSLPLTNNTVPSYVKWLQLPANRLPGYSSIKRNDVVVFNYPEGDTVDVEIQANQSYYSMIRSVSQQAKREELAAGQPEKPDAYYYKIAKNYLLENRKFTIRPVDKRENYIKRCVAIAGDEIEIKEGILYVNKEKSFMAEEMQYVYFVTFKNTINLTDRAKANFKKEYNVNLASIMDASGNGTTFRMPLTKEMVEKIKLDPNVVNVERYINPKPALDAERTLDYPYYPNVKSYNWTEDNFGPLVIPSAGMTIDLTIENLPLFKRPIRVYEGNDLKVKNGKIWINGEETTTYTFKMNYYWLMGDNRHNSADSRFWGFVPEDHVVGKASFVWLSIDPELPSFDGGLRFDKMFRTVK